MNYYQILEIKPSASKSEIKQAYRRLAKKFHPDSQKSSANHEEIVRLNQAYEVLINPENRYIYDQQINLNSVKKRQQKNNSASSQYQRERQAQREREFSEFHWLKDVYAPLNNIIQQILIPLDSQLYDLSADPFDDELMADFLDYLDICGVLLEKGKNISASQPNPSQYADVAVNLYYCLNHIADGIEELARFTQTYDEDYLYTGKELFNLARRINQEATVIANQFR